jgi:hypothetical protein
LRVSEQISEICFRSLKLSALRNRALNQSCDRA